MAPILTTHRLTLRPFTLDDLDPLFMILQEPGIFKYFPRTANPSKERVSRMINEQLEQYARYGFGEWAVEKNEKKGLLGWCGLNFLPDTDEYEVAYLLRSAARGQGLATEAANACLDYGFGPGGLERIIALVHPDNIASRRVAEKIGMSLQDRKYYWGMECLRFTKTRNNKDFK